MIGRLREAEATIQAYLDMAITSAAQIREATDQEEITKEHHIVWMA